MPQPDSQSARPDHVAEPVDDGDIDEHDMRLMLADLQALIDAGLVVTRRRSDGQLGYAIADPAVALDCSDRNAA
jgi:hypothetical protein